MKKEGKKTDAEVGRIFESLLPQSLEGMSKKEALDFLTMMGVEDKAIAEMTGISEKTLHVMRKIRMQLEEKESG